MMRSLNEIQGMVLKAARGAGVPLGIAEDWSAVAGHLVQNAALPDYLAALAQVHTPANGVWFASGDLAIADARALMAGPAALDALAGETKRAALKDLDSPKLLECLVAPTTTALVADEGMHFLMPEKAAPVTVTGPLDVDPTIWAALDAFAQKTYVPATEASRLKGAGAGLTDND